MVDDDRVHRKTGTDRSRRERRRVGSARQRDADVGAERMLLNRMQVDAVAEAPGGAHFTLSGSYRRDEAFQRHYAQAAKQDDTWEGFHQRFLSGTESDYQDAVKAFAAENAAKGDTK